MKHGSVRTCLRNGRRGPFKHFRSVCFKGVEAYWDRDRRPLDKPQPPSAAGALWTHASTPLFHSICRDDDCLFAFDAIFQALQLRTECIHNFSDDIFSQLELEINLKLQPYLWQAVVEDPFSRDDSTLIPSSPQQTPVTKLHLFDPNGENFVDSCYEVPGDELAGQIAHLPTIPLHLQPAWIQHLFDLWTRSIGEITEKDELGVRSWYLNPHRYMTTQVWRPMRLSPSHDHWFNDLRAVWHDMLEHDLPVEVFLVEPNPPRPTTDWKYPVDLIICQSLEDADWLRPSIVVTSLLGHYTRMHTIARLLPWTTSKWEVIYLSDNDRFCAGPSLPVDFHRLCEMFRGDRELQLVEVQYGDCLCLHLHPPTQIALEPDEAFFLQSAEVRSLHTEDDCLSLMGRNPIVVRSRPEDDFQMPNPHSDSFAGEMPQDPPFGHRSFSVIIFTRNYDAVVGRMNPRQVDEMYDIAAAMLDISMNRLVRLYEMPSPPRDLENMHDRTWIANRLNDVPPGSNGKLILLDVSFCNQLPCLQPEVIRQVKLLTSPITRTSILQLTGLFPYCEQWPCLTQLNYDFIPQRAPVDIRHGDYVLITVGPPDPFHCPDTRLAALAFHHGFHSEDLSRLSQQLPDNMHPEQIPNPDVELDSLEFDYPRVELYQSALQLNVPLRSVRLDDTPNIRQRIEDARNEHDAIAQDVFQPNLDDLPETLRNAFEPWNEIATTWFDDQRWATIAVWYVSHLRWRICPQPRFVWVSDDLALWRQAIIDAWSDQIDVHDAIEFAVVRPTPIRREPNVAAHVIIIQHQEQQNEHACLVSLIDEGFRPGLVDRQALVLPNLVTHQTLLSTSNRLHECLMRPMNLRCTTRCGSFSLTNEPMIGWAGLSYSVHIERFAQMPPAPWAGNQIFPVSIAADAPQLVHMLHSAIVQRRDAIPHQPINLRISTWYLDYVRHRVCLYGREVDLPLNPNLWLPTIIQHWQDLYDDRVPVEGCLVYPTPSVYQWQNEDVFHVIIHQRHMVGFSSILTTTFDMTRQNLYAPGIQRAVIVPTTTTDDAVLDAIDLRNWCMLDQHFCQVFFIDNLLTSANPSTSQSGHSFRVYFFDAPFAPEPALNDDHDLRADDMNLMQLNVKKKTILLEDHIPTIETKIPCSDLEFLWQQSILFSLGEPQELATVVKWHDATQLAFQDTPPWNDEDPIGYTFYTDGSACHGADGWKGAAAVVRIIETENGPRFGGYHCVTVTDVATAPRAEITAIFAALIWTVETMEWHCSHYSNLPQIGFGFDSLLAGYTASGDWKISTHQDIQIHNRAIVCWIETRFRIHLHWFHVPAHSGHAWNEAADAISWAALNEWIIPKHIDDFIDQLTLGGRAPHLSQWLWYFEASRLGLPGFLPIQHNCFVARLDQPLSQRPVAESHSFLKSTHKDVTSTTRAPFMLRCATANVLTLYPTQHAYGSYISGRQEALMEEFHSHSFHVVGIQESRSKASGHLHSEHFHILSAPATAKGVGGVQLWISKHWSVNGASLTIKPHHMKIIHATSQRIVVRLSISTLRLLLIVGHAPDSSQIEVVQQWWDFLSSAVPATLKQWPTILLCDANARLGSHTSDAVGDHQSHPENDAGAIFHQWLLDHQMFLPQTQSGLHHGPGHTWCHPKGQTARLDYVAISTDLIDPRIQTRLADVDLALHRTDHLAVQIDIPVRLDVPINSKPASIDDPPQHECFHPTWNLDVHTHAAQLHEFLRSTCSSALNSKLKRKTHLTDHTWNLIAHKKYHWRRCKQIARTHTHAILRQIFDTWKRGRGGLFPEAPSANNWLKLADQTLAWHSFQYQFLATTTATAVRQDDQAYYQSLAESSGNVAADEGVGGLWKRIKFLLPKQVLKRKSNIRCCGPEHSELTEHYNSLEAGVSVEYSHLLQTVVDAQKNKVADAPLEVSLDMLPTRFDVEKHIHQAKHGRAPGLDNLTIDQLRPLVSWLSQPIFQLFLKSWLLAAEPLQYKGGILVSILKKPGSWTVSNLRGIMLIENVGKIFHALLRAKLLPWATERKLAHQYGGFRGQQTAHASLHLRAFMNIVKAKRLSCAVVFIDLRSAFHSLLREHAFGTGDALPQRLCALLENEGFDVGALNENIAEHSAAFQAISDPSLVRIIQEAHQGTWYHLPPTANCQQTFRGSRPGSPVADIAFNILMTTVLNSIRSALDEVPTLLAAQTAIDAPIPLITWVDDVAIPIPIVDLGTVSQTLASVLQILHRTFADFGLQINLSPGKTEVLFQPRGPRAAQTRRELFIDEFAHIPVGLSEPLRLVTQYKHLGMLIAHNIAIDRDLAQRLGRARTAFSSLRKSLFTNRHIPVHVRLQLLEALVLPRIFYGCGAWPLLTRKQFNTLSHGIMQWQRTIIGNGFWSDRCCSDDHLRSQWGLMDLSIRLAKHRLLYALQAHSQVPPDLWICILQEAALCPARDTWLHAVLHSLQWYATMCTQHPILLDQPITQEVVLAWISQSDAQEPRRIRHAVRRHLQQESAIYHAVQGHSDVFEACKSKGVEFDHFGPVAPDRDDAYKCHLCTKSFSSTQGLNAHLWKQHQHISLERRYVFSDTCLACGRCFWTPQRMQQHLKYSRHYEGGCLEHLVKFYKPLDAPVTFDKPWSLEHVHRLPWVYAQGPIPQDDLPVWEVQRQTELASIQKRWNDSGFPDRLPTDCKQQVHADLDRITHAWIDSSDDDDALIFEWLHCTDSYLAGDDPDHGPLLAQWAFLEWGQTGMYNLLDEVEDPDHIVTIEKAFLSIAAMLPMWNLLNECDRLHYQKPPALPDLALYRPDTDARTPALVEPFPDSVRDQAMLLAPFSGQMPLKWPQVRGVPVLEFEDGRRVLVVFHLFSGRRRDGDCHDWYHRLISTYFCGVDVMICGIDTAIHPQLCDLAQGPHLDTIHSLAVQGVPAVCLAGPPCETWTAARHLDLPDSVRRGPRPLRSAQQPWALPHLSIRELLQVSMGTRLMLGCHKIELLTYLGGGASIKEHPALPRPPDFASIWRTDLHRNIVMSAPGAQHLLVEQWKYGAASVKPTHLSVLGLPPTGRHLRACELPGLERPTATLQGVDPESGQFRTAKAKEYPSGLCRALVVATLSGLRRRVADEGWKPIRHSLLGEREQTWLRDVTNCTSQAHATTFLPDYQPSV